LRGAQRRSNPLSPLCHCEERSAEAIPFTSRVIARSAAPKQSPSHPVNRRRLLRLPGGRLAMTHLSGGRGSVRAVPVSCVAGLIGSPRGSPSILPCHCEERSEEAIPFRPRVIARSAAPKQSPSHPVNRKRLLRLLAQARHDTGSEVSHSAFHHLDTPSEVPVYYWAIEKSFANWHDEKEPAHVRTSSAAAWQAVFY